MHALRGCDFCDADAVGTFEVVPPELEPAPEERRRTLLCGSCRDRLETLLEPVLERAMANEATVDGNGKTPLEGEGDADARRDEEDPDDVGEDRSPSDDRAGDVEVGEPVERDDASPVRSSDDGAVGTQRPPRSYRKVVRLLRNREFPMGRSGFESLAANAYDLEQREVEAIVDYAIEQGELVQRGSDLDRP